MSRPRGLKYHAQEWGVIFDWMESHPTEEFSITCEDAQRARALRLEFYRARAALLADPDAEKALYPTLRSREASILADHTVLIRPREKTPVAQLLRESIKANIGVKHGKQ